VVAALLTSTSMRPKFDDAVDQPGDIGQVGEVGLHEGTAQLARDEVSALGVSRRQDHGGPFGDQGCGDRPTDPGRAP
jgi:hypothetical protein